MAQTLEKLTQQALELSAEDRVVLAERLLLTIDESHDTSLIDDATLVELERRRRELCDGTVRGIPAEEALRQARAAIKRPE
jgi:putative addiction module component (TIGR02574 family)